MDKIFVSYSRTDGEFVDRLRTGLEERGHSLWIDQMIMAGSAWREEISKAIRECHAFLLVITPNSEKSNSVIRELYIADQHKRYIIPILYGVYQVPSSMEYQIADLQRVDFSANPFDSAMDDLDAALRYLPAPAQAAPAAQLHPDAGRGAAPARAPAGYAPQPAISLPYPQAQPTGSGKWMAMVSLGLGLINLCAWVIPLVGIPLSLAGIVTGALGLKSERRSLGIIGL